MKIAVLTTFYELNKAYSLTSVVENQLVALAKHGYEAVLFVHDNFKDYDKVPEGVEVRNVIPRFNLVDYSSNQPVSEDFWQQVDKTRIALEENLSDIDLTLTHDWIFQGWFLPYNVAMRKANLNCKWLHWIHSAPSPRPNIGYPHDCRYKTMPNSKLIYMNNYDALKLAEMYGGKLDDVRVVFNPLDPRTFCDFQPLTQHLIEKFKLLEADVIDVYPVSSTRFSGKQVDKVIRVLGQIKKQGKSVRFVCPNAHANAEREKNEIERMLKYGEEQGLAREEMVFTSLEGEEYELGVSNEVVRDLFSLSNLFIFPTKSENCPLILLEAALSKTLLVLNESFYPLRDFFGESALYFKFGSLLENVRYDDEKKFYHDVALIIIGELNKNKPLNAFTKLKQRFSNDWVFKNQLEPILYELCQMKA